MTSDIHTLAQRLASHAEAVCAYYLSNGTKNGRWWLVGDVFNTPGRSLYVRLAGPTSGPGAAGKWTDAATGEHGDLIDLIQINRNLATLSAVRAEVMAFLSEPVHFQSRPREPVPRNSPASARRLFAASKPIIGTLAETYLRARGITCALNLPSLRFHPGCYYCGNDTAIRQSLPALIAAVTNPSGDITGVHRIYLSADGRDKAPVASPRLALGDVLGNGVRFGIIQGVMAAGEGVETMLALRSLLPTMPMMAALSANHLAALHLPPTLQRLYIAHDVGHAGLAAAETLALRAIGENIDVRLLSPMGDDDWNADLMQLELASLVGHLTTLMAVTSPLVHGADNLRPCARVRM